MRYIDKRLTFYYLFPLISLIFAEEKICVNLRDLREIKIKS